MFTPFLLIHLIAAEPTEVVAAQEYAVGVAKVDVTPDYPVRLHGFGFRKTESEGVKQRIWVKALAIGDKDPFILITADNLGVPRWMTNQVAEKLAKHGVGRERLCICATHTHTAPMLEGIAPTIFGADLPPDHRAHVERYTKEFAEALVKVSEQALANRQPSTLTWGVGTLKFAINRRPQKGPVDHDLPVMFVKDRAGKVRATLSSYACHCVTLSFNIISGDWAGCAAETIENQFPESVALLAIGCGADSNPSSGVTGGNWAAAEQQGREYAAEVKRLAQNFLAPIAGSMSAKCKSLQLPLADPPTAEDWQKKSERKDAVGHHARVQQNRLRDGKQLPKHVDYEVCVWRWGDSLAMAFMPGEVVVDFSLRLKKELDARRLWVNAYANDDPCYIPSERVLKEGGYEGEFAMVYYDLPTKFRPGLETPIVDDVKDCAGETFKAPFDANKVQTPPRSPQQSLSSIQVGDDLVVDLVAAEPLVVDPVAIAFGADGKLWVAEMNDYPSGNKRGEPGGRIRFLEDRNGDGIFDASTTFLSGIPYPTGVTVWRNGVLVCAAPDILFAEDTNGDGKADVVKKIFSGFATSNYQARVNSLEYGLDGWVYGSCGSTGGDIKNERGEVVKLGRCDFRCKPDLGIIEPAAGSSQQGRVRNDWGDWFGCDNTNLAWHYPLPADILSRNPHVAAPTNVVRVPDGPASKLYAISNQQMFALSGPVGHATAACGIGFNRGQHLGDVYRNNLFSCESVHNCVHRMQLVPQGSTFVGKRPDNEQNREFLASTDTWFRPVQVRTGTDGALWVVDMYRYVIEHPMWIPPEERGKHDLRAGSTMGRIYRVRNRRAIAEPLPKWEPKAADRQVANLNGAISDLAMQQLFWNDRKDVVHGLGMIAGTTHLSQLMVQSLAAAAVLGDGGHLKKRALQYVFPAGRQMLRYLGDHHANDPEVLERLLQWVEYPNAQADSFMDGLPRIELAVALGKFKDERAVEGLIRLALRKEADQFLRFAVLSSINSNNVAKAVEIGLKREAPAELVRPLVASAVGYGKAQDLANVFVLNDRSNASTFAALEGLLQGLSRQKWKHFNAADKLNASLKFASRQAADSKIPAEKRIAFLRLLGWLPDAKERETAAIATILETEQPGSVANAAIEVAGRLRTMGTFDVLVRRWNALSPMQRGRALDVLLQSDDGIKSAAAAVVAKKIPTGDVDAARRDRLLKVGNLDLREKLKNLIAPLQANRAAVIASYKSVDGRQGDLANGKAVFAKHCAGCHRLDDAGYTVGPDLAMVALKPVPYLLQEILDPNRNLDARYSGYTALLADGRTLTGLLEGETETSVALLGQDGKRTELLRSEIEKIAGQGKSLMPEGVEQQVPPADMADLLAYIRNRLPPPKSFHGNTPKVIAAENGEYLLPARFAEVRGATIKFVVPQFALEYWQSMDDVATWEVDVAKSGAFFIELDYGVPSQAAGNVMLLEGGEKPFRHKLVSTGGWENYKRVRVGEIELAGGRRRLTIKPDGESLREALMDLRAVHLVPK